MTDATPTTETTNVLNQSLVDDPCARVWEIAFEALAEQGAEMSRKAVVDACVTEGIATYTARTQYQRWFTAVIKGGAA